MLTAALSGRVGLRKDGVVLPFTGGLLRVRCVFYGIVPAGGG